MKEILETIIKNPKLEARLLNTLSLLEFIGARKIFKTVCQGHPPLEALEHFSDEARHAMVFKKLATLLNDGICEEYLCREEGIAYFQTLDRNLSEWISKLTGDNQGRYNYLMVTSIIERRAMKLYPLYRKLTRNGFVRDELKKVVEEESNHRRFIEDECLKVLNQNDVPDFSECDQIEEKLFQKFSDAIRREVNP